LVLLSCGCVVASLGLFMLVINGVTLWIASWICVNWLNIGFYVDGLWPAILGAIIISIVTFLMALVLPDDQPA
jgi:putative membrane protein